MFSRKKVAAPSAANPAPATSLKRPVRSSIPSIIGVELVVRGPLISTGDVQIEGRVEGDVRSAGLAIGDGGVVRGNVAAEDAAVRGHVEGNVRARKVLLASSCRIDGNILYKTIAVETGANVQGNFRHADDPLSDAIAPDKKRP